MELSNTDEVLSYIDDFGELIEPSDKYDSGYNIDSNYLDLLNNTSTYYINKSASLLEQNMLQRRSDELDDNRIYRKINDSQLERNLDGTLETDSNAELYAKEAYNAGINVLDWVAEASENIADFGQGNWLDNAKISAVIGGKNYSMETRDFVSARDTSIDELRKQYNNAEYNPNADKVFYATRKFDGLNDDGTSKYLYKYGVHNVSTWDRYKDQYVQDGYELIDEKRFLGAEKFENTLHALDEALKYRAIDQGNVKTADGRYISRDEASTVNFGSGYTELYSKDLLGLDTGSSNEYKNNLKESERTAKEYHLKDKKGSNWIDAMQSSSIMMGADFIDFFADLGGKDSHIVDKFKDDRYVDNITGYDRREESQALAEAQNAIKNNDYMSAIAHVGSVTPELLGETAPYIASIFIGAGEAATAQKASKLFSTLSNMEKAGKSAKTITAYERKIEKTLGSDVFNKYKKYKDMSRVTSSTNAFLKNYGMFAAHTANVNSILDDRLAEKRKTNPNAEISTQEALGMWIAELPFTMLDKIAAGDILLGKGASKAIKDSIKYVPKSKTGELTKKVVSSGAALLGSASEEAAQEYFQTWGEILGKQLGVDDRTIGDILSDEDNNAEAQVGAIAGLTTGGAMHTGSAPIRAASNIKDSYIKGRVESIKNENIRRLSNDLTDDEFDFYVSNAENDIVELQDNATTLEDMKSILNRSRSVDDLKKSRSEEIRRLGDTIEDQSYIKLLNDNNDYIESQKSDIYENIKSGNAVITDDIASIINIDLNEYSSLNDTDKDAYIKNKVYSLSPDSIIKLNKISKANEDIGQSTVVSSDNNIYTNSDYIDNRKKIEQEIFDDSNIIGDILFNIDESLSSMNSSINEAKKSLSEQIDFRKNNYKQKNTSPIKKEYVELSKNEDGTVRSKIVNAFNSIRNIGKLRKELDKYSDESLKSLYNEDIKLATRKSIEGILESRAKTREEIAKIDNSNKSESFKININNKNTRYKKNALKNIEKISRNKKIKTLEEKNDLFSAINEAYIRGYIDNSTRTKIINESIEKAIIDNNLGSAVKNNDTLMKLDNMVLSGVLDYNNAQTIKINELNGILDDNLVSDKKKSKFIGKHNVKTYASISNALRTKPIENKKDFDEFVSIINDAEALKHITKKQKKVLLNRLNTIGKDAKNKIFKKKKVVKEELTKEKIQESINSKIDEKLDTVVDISELSAKIESGEDLTSFEKEEYINKMNKISEIDNEIEELEVLSKSEEILNDINIDFDTISETEKEMAENRILGSKLLNFCL